MAIDNAEAVAFANNRARPASDRSAQLYWWSKAMIQEWYANDLGGLIPPTDDVIDDGSAADGRHPITGNDVNNLITLLQGYVTQMEANGNAQLNVVLGISPNPLP